MITRIIYPLYLRNAISYRLRKFFPDLNDKDVSLEFDKNIKFDLSKNDVGHKAIIFNGFYDLKLSQTIVQLAKEGGTLIDVGANYGYFSCLWAALNPRNAVFAFEASPNNIAPLRNNIEKNQLEDSIKIIPTALGKEKGKLLFNLATEEQQSGWGGFTISEDTSSIEVDVDTLDQYCHNHHITQIKVLKIDTEGADTWVLYGAKELLMNKKIEHIFFEQNASRMRLLNIEKNEAFDFLKTCGYSIELHSPGNFHAW